MSQIQIHGQIAYKFSIKIFDEIEVAWCALSLACSDPLPIRKAKKHNIDIGRLIQKKPLITGYLEVVFVGCVRAVRRCVPLELDRERH